jgi:IclR family transcriptional regulator, acetate operon repressor
MQNDQARSIKRTLEVLEYFDEEHTAVSVSEISRELDYPQSSTSILLKSLMNLGYLTYDESTRRYRPTARVALLGRGIRPYLFGEGTVMAALEEVSEKTGELVLLASRAGYLVHYIHTIQARNPLRMYLRTGTIRPLVGSAIGILFLHRMSNQEVEALLEKAEMRHELDAVMKEVRKIRKQQVLVSEKTNTPGGGVIGMMLPHGIDGHELAICIGGVATVLRSNADRYIEILREAITRNVRNLEPTTELRYRH